MIESDATDLVADYAGFIQQHNWDWWCHLTFAKAPSRGRAFAAVSAWINGINKKIFGRNYAKRGQGVQWLRAVEHQKLGAYHFHLLIKRCEDIHTSVGVAKWKKWGDAKIQVYDEQLGEGAALYIAKRVGAGGLDFGGPWTVLEPRGNTPA